MKMSRLRRRQGGGRDQEGTVHKMLGKGRAGS